MEEQLFVFVCHNEADKAAVILATKDRLNDIVNVSENLLCFRHGELSGDALLAPALATVTSPLINNRVGGVV
jgi:hypothetical protein